MCVRDSAVCMNGSQGNLQELVPSFYHVGSSDQTQVNRPGSIYFYLLSHLTSLKANVF